MPTLSNDANAPGAAKAGGPTYGPFKLKPDFAGDCARADVIDVDLGHTPASFVRAAHCQIAGQPAPPAVVETWSQKMRDEYYVRRIDVVRSLCAQAKRECKLAYSDPWVTEVELSGAPPKNAKRDVGAVFMFFFECPGHVFSPLEDAVPVDVERDGHALGLDHPA